ncbi:cell division protein ZipA [Marinobacter nauticus]
MSLREWLIAIGALVIIGVVIDGLRRMHRARKESMAISSSMGADDLDDSPLEEDFNPELPNGGARRIASGEGAEASKPRQKAETRPRKASPEPDNPSEPLTSTDNEVTPEGGWGATEAADDEGILGKPRVVKARTQQAEPEPQPQKTVTAKPEPKSEPKTRTQKKAARKQKAEETQEPPLVTDVEKDTAQRTADKPGKSQPPAGANRPEAREVVVINVLASSGEQFQGPALKKLFEACGLEHGDLDIYHRHEGADTTTPVQFSVASAVEPGTFRPDEMPTLETPGISFFMSLPGPSNAMQAFDFMLETAQCVVRNMGGELKDERRSVMTPQTIEHCRQRIREFERKQRSPRN